MLIVFPLCCVAEGKQPQSVSLSEAVSKKIIIETIYQFYVRRYKQDLEVTPSSFVYSRFSSNLSPDMSVLNILSALAMNDQEIYESYLVDDGLDIKEYIGNFKELSQVIGALDNVVNLIYRVDIGPMRREKRKERAIINYQVISKGKRETLFEGNLHFENISGWRLIRNDDNIISRHWKYQGPKKLIELDDG